MEWGGRIIYNRGSGNILIDRSEMALRHSLSQTHTPSERARKSVKESESERVRERDRQTELQKD